MNKIPFDPNSEDALEVARAIVLQRLRTDISWKQISTWSGYKGFDGYVEYIGNEDDGRLKLLTLATEIIWELILQGVLSPGQKPQQSMSNWPLALPFFYITDYGHKALKEQQYIPYDPTGYLKRFRAEAGTLDATVEAYLTESLNCFTRGCNIASVMMIGIASERAFLLLCDSLYNALTDVTERKEFGEKMSALAIKPKLDWVLGKITHLPKNIRKQLPDNISVMVTTVFDFIRTQRNDLGHPSDEPPKIGRAEAFAYLTIFPRYLKIVKQAIEFFNMNTSKI